MENLGRTETSLGLPPLPNKPFTPSPFSMVASATATQAWKKPYFMNHGDQGGASSSGPKLHSPPSDANTFPPSLDDDHDQENTQTQNSAGNEASGSGAGDGSVKADESEGTVARVEVDMDPRKLRRIVSNRLSAQKSRVKKLQHLNDMERKVKTLEAQIAMLTPQVVLYRKKQQLLKTEQRSLNQQISAYENNKIIKDAKIEENRAEVNRLRQLHLKQQQQMQYKARVPVWEQAGLHQTINPSLSQSGSGQMVYMNTNQGQIGETLEVNNRLNHLNITEPQPKLDFPSSEYDYSQERTKHAWKSLNPTSKNYISEAKPTLGQTWKPTWESSHQAGQMITNPTFQNQSEAPMVNSKLNLGGIEEMLINFNKPMDQNAGNCFI